MKDLSLKQAQNCENAKEPVCKCRCGGTLHGAKRGGDDPDRKFFEALGIDDPHRLLTKEEKREIVKARKRNETKRKNEMIAAAWAKLYAPVEKGN